MHSVLVLIVVGLLASLPVRSLKWDTGVPWARRKEIEKYTKEITWKSVVTQPMMMLMALKRSEQLISSVEDVMHPNQLYFDKKMKEAVETVMPLLPPEDPLLSGDGPRYDSCAVVGSSAILKDSNKGEEIDAHDAVLRFNYAPVGGSFARDVGSKTTMMLTGQSTSLGSHYPPFRNYTHFLRHGLREVVLLLRESGPTQIAHRLHELSQHRKVPLMYVVSNWFRQVSNSILRQFGTRRLGDPRNPIGEQYKATSGLRGVLLAAWMCKKVDVYGFGTSAVYGHGHYFATVKAAVLENPGHNYSIEHDLIRYLAEGELPVLNPLRQALVKGGFAHVDDDGDDDDGMHDDDDSHSESGPLTGSSFKLRKLYSANTRKMHLPYARGAIYFHEDGSVPYLPEESHAAAIFSHRARILAEYKEKQAKAANQGWAVDGKEGGEAAAEAATDGKGEVNSDGDKVTTRDFTSLKAKAEELQRVFAFVRVPDAVRLLKRFRGSLLEAAKALKRISKADDIKARQKQIEAIGDEEPSEQYANEDDDYSSSSALEHAHVKLPICLHNTGDLGCACLSGDFCKYPLVCIHRVCVNLD